MIREETIFQILDFLTEGEMAFETLCEEMQNYHPQVAQSQISETLQYLLEEQYIRMVEEAGNPVKWHGMTEKGKEYYYKLAKRRYPEG